MRVLIACLGFLITASAAASASTEVFFGEDLGTGNNDPPLDEPPNADAALAEFLQALAVADTEDLEGLPAGQTSAVDWHFGPQIQAELSGRGEVEPIASGTENGTYPLSGEKFWLVDNPTGPYTITFATQQEAFGFHATDVGDHGSQIRIRLDGSEELFVPATVGRPSGGIIFFGVLRAGEPFSSVTFEDTVGVDGVGYDDDVAGSLHGPTPAGEATWGRIKTMDVR